MPSMLLYGIPLAVIIPLAAILILGKWIRGGSVASASGVSALAFAVFWLEIQSATLAATNPLSPPASAATLWANSLIAFCTLVSAALLLLVAWAIALADAIQSHRWGWVALLCLALYATIAAIVRLVSSPLLTCAYSAYSPPQPSACLIISPVTRMFIIAGCFVGPATALVYALRQHARRSRALPEGLIVSSLDEPQIEPL